MAKSKTKAGSKSKQESAGAKVKKARQEIVRSEIIELDKQIEQGYLDLARLLSEAFHAEFHADWGHQTFESFCNSELSTHYRKAKYLISIYDKVKFLDLPKDRVEKLGWTKMKEIATVIDAENAKEWLEKAEKLTSRELEDEVSTVKRRRVGGSSTPAMVTMTFKMTDVEANPITEALEEAKKLCEADNDSIALEMICQDWLMDRAEKPATRSLADQITYLEKVYGVHIDYKVFKPGESQEEKAEEIIQKSDEKKGNGGDDPDDTEAEEIEESGGPDDGGELDIDSLLGLDG